MVPVESSNLQSVGHSKDGLFVRFKGGGLYRYPEAPKSLFDEMVDAKSPGSLFRSKVVGQFKHRKLDDG